MSVADKMATKVFLFTMLETHMLSILQEARHKEDQSKQCEPTQIKEKVVFRQRCHRQTPGAYPGMTPKTPVEKSIKTQRITASDKTMPESTQLETLLFLQIALTSKVMQCEPPFASLGTLAKRHSKCQISRVTRRTDERAEDHT